MNSSRILYWRGYGKWINKNRVFKVIFSLLFHICSSMMYFVVLLYNIHVCIFNYCIYIIIDTLLHLCKKGAKFIKVWGRTRWARLENSINFMAKQINIWRQYKLFAKIVQNWPIFAIYASFEFSAHCEVCVHVPSKPRCCSFFWACQKFYVKTECSFVVIYSM